MVASSTNGKITLKNTLGSVKIATTNGEIELYNTSANDIKIDSGKTIIATGLLGKVDISAKKDINIAFNSISENVIVMGAARCKNINITANKTSINNLNVYLATTGKNNLAKIYKGETVFKEAATIQPDEANNLLKTIKVNASNCNINLYLKND